MGAEFLVKFSDVSQSGGNNRWKSRVDQKLSQTYSNLFPEFKPVGTQIPPVFISSDPDKPKSNTGSSKVVSNPATPATKPAVAKKEGGVDSPESFDTDLSDREFTANDFANTKAGGKDFTDLTGKASTNTSDAKANLEMAIRANQQPAAKPEEAAQTTSAAEEQPHSTPADPSKDTKSPYTKWFGKLHNEPDTANTGNGELVFNEADNLKPRTEGEQISDSVKVAYSGGNPSKQAGWAYSPKGSSEVCSAQDDPSITKIADPKEPDPFIEGTTVGKASLVDYTKRDKLLKKRPPASNLDRNAVVEYMKSGQYRNKNRLTKVKTGAVDKKGRTIQYIEPDVDYRNDDYNPKPGAKAGLLTVRFSSNRPSFYSTR